MRKMWDRRRYSTIPGAHTSIIINPVKFSPQFRRIVLDELHKGYRELGYYSKARRFIDAARQAKGIEVEEIILNSWNCIWPDGWEFKPYLRRAFEAYAPAERVADKLTGQSEGICAKALHALDAERSSNYLSVYGSVTEFKAICRSAIEAYIKDHGLVKVNKPIIDMILNNEPIVLNYHEPRRTARRKA